MTLEQRLRRLEARAALHAEPTVRMTEAERWLVTLSLLGRHLPLEHPAAGPRWQRAARQGFRPRHQKGAIWLDYYR